MLSTVVQNSTISIHFWNLGAYVGGTLIGDWVDLDDCLDYEDFQARVAKATRNAEELILGDVDSEFGISFWEYVSLDTVWKAHEALREIASCDREAFGDYLAYVGGTDHLDEALETFEDRYEGQHKSIEDFAWSQADELWPDLSMCPSGFRVEVDVIAWECDYWISDNGHVFRCY